MSPTRLKLVCYLWVVTFYVTVQPPNYGKFNYLLSHDIKLKCSITLQLRQTKEGYCPKFVRFTFFSSVCSLALRLGSVALLSGLFLGSQPHLFRLIPAVVRCYMLMDAVQTANHITRTQASLWFYITLPTPRR